jgi:hypothetical protein
MIRSISGSLRSSSQKAKPSAKPAPGSWLCKIILIEPKRQDFGDRSHAYPRSERHAQLLSPRYHLLRESNLLSTSFPMEASFAPTNLRAVNL